MSVNGGKLILAGAPLGNVADASPRLKEALGSADVIFAEDTRRLRHLAGELGATLSREIHSLFSGNEQERIPQLKSFLNEGKTVLLITDAGMPGVSDPGYLPVAAALELGVPVEVIPGPSAVTTALALSGLPMERFIFDGFPPRTQKARNDYIDSMKNQERTIVLFEAPHRVKDLVVDLLDILGAARRVALCREMTKTYEETFRGSLSSLNDWLEGREILGEVTIVIEGAKSEEIRNRTPEEITRLVAQREEAGMDRKEAISAVAEELRVRKREVFDALVATKMEQ